jgi:Domain of unknown function (DUF4203)
MITLLRVVAGAALLTLGRKLFWLFIAAIGFETGVLIATRFLHPSSDVMVVVIALALGILGALLALFIENLVVTAAGFLAGGYLLVSALDLLRLNPGQFEWVVYLVGGIIGAALAIVVLDWALIILSSLSGSVVISRALLPARHELELVVIVVLFVVGVAIQYAIWHGEHT